MKVSGKKRGKKIAFMCFGIFGVVLLFISVFVSNLLVTAALCRPTQSIWDNDAYASVEADVEASYVITDETDSNMQQAYLDRQEWLEQTEIENVRITSQDGFKLSANLYVSQSESHQWALLLHGYGYTGKKEETEYIGARYGKKNYQVLAPDMRCHGESEGDFIGMGWTDRQDILDWISFILKKDPQATIILHGQSMGAAAALMAAGEDLPKQVKSVIADCAYTDVWEVFSKKMKDWFYLPPFPILYETNAIFQLRGGYDLKGASALKQIKNCKIPVLFIHGNEDDFVPVEMANTLYDAAECPKELLIVEGAGHGLSNYVDPDLYYDTVFSFLDSH